MTKVLLAGATGMVGATTFTLLLADERVEQVMAPTRRPVPPHAKLLNPTMTSEDRQPEAAWWAVDGAISALGTTRANAGSAAAYRAIDYDYALAVAKQVTKARDALRAYLVDGRGCTVPLRLTWLE